MKQNVYHLKHIEIWEENSPIIKTFIPRVPTKRAHEENKTIPRICTSKTIEGCALGHPSVAYMLIGMQNDPNLFESSYEYFTYFLELKESGILVRVYHFEAEDSIVKTAETISENGWVPDVLKTGEHWITDSIPPSKVSYAILKERVIGYDEERRSPISRVQVAREAQSLEDWGVFLNCAVLDSYIAENRHEKEKVLEKPMSKKEAVVFKQQVEARYQELLAEASLNKKKASSLHSIQDKEWENPLEASDADLPF